MRGMKDSGVEWIGEIPETWTPSKMKYLGEYINGYAFKPEDWGNTGLKIIRIQDLTGSNDNPNYFAGTIAEKYRVKTGDILVSWAATLDAFIWKQEDGWLNQHIFKAIPNEEIIKYDFFFWMLKIAMENMNNDNKHGIMMQHITLDVFNNFVVPLPPLETQQRIAEYLDSKCAKIDEIISKQEAVIEKLKAYKQSLITEAVTKGLNPEVEMKDSGIEWIGEIPKDWIVSKIKHEVKLSGRIGWQGLTSAEYSDEGAYLITGINFENGSINWNTCVHVPHERWEEASQIQISNEDLLITKDGTVGKVAIVRDMPAETSLNSGVLLIRNENFNFKRFLYWVLISNVFWKWFAYINAGNSTIIHLYQHSFENFSFPLPEEKEFTKIADYLDKKCIELDKIVERKQSVIEKLTAYKKSLIYEVVTGKREV